MDIYLYKVFPLQMRCLWGKKRAGEWDNFNPNLCLGNGLALEGPFGVGKIFGLAQKCPLCIQAPKMPVSVEVPSLCNIYLYIISIWVFPKIGGYPPKSSILIGISSIFTIKILGNTHI